MYRFCQYITIYIYKRSVISWNIYTSLLDYIPRVKGYHIYLNKIRFFSKWSSSDEQELLDVHNNYYNVG